MKYLGKSIVWTLCMLALACSGEVSGIELEQNAAFLGGGQALLETEPNNSFGSCNPMAIGDSMAGYPQQMPDADYYCVELEAGDHVELHLDAPRLMRVNVYDPSYQLAATNWHTRSFRFRFEAPQTGTYRILLTFPLGAPAGEESSYVMTLTDIPTEVEPNGTMLTCSPFEIGTTVFGSQQLGDPDYYCVALEAGTLVEFRTDSLFWQTMGLFNSQYTQVANNNNTSNKWLRYEVLESGVYSLLVASGLKQGDYFLSARVIAAESEPNGNGDSCEQLEPGQMMFGNSAGGYDYDTYCVELPAGGVFSFDVDSFDLGHAGVMGFWVFNANFELLIDHYDSQGVMDDPYLEYEVPEGGTFYVFVLPREPVPGGEESTYILSVNGKDGGVPLLNSYGPGPGDRILVEWDKAAGNTRGYRVAWAPGSIPTSCYSAPSYFDVSDPSVTSHIITGLIPGQNYGVRVCAKDVHGTFYAGAVPLEIDVAEYPADPASTAEMNLRVLVVMADATGQSHLPAEDGALLQYSAKELGDQFFEHPDGMNSFFDEASYGHVSLSGTVVGWIEQGDLGIQAPEMSNEKEAYFDRACYLLDCSQYDVFIIHGWTEGQGDMRGWRMINSVVTSHDTYTNVGVVFLINASVYESTVWDGNPSVEAKILPSSRWAHEFGHTLDMDHDESLLSDQSVIGPECQHKNYGHSFSVMGLAGLTNHPTFVAKNAVGWLPDSQITTIPLDAQFGSQTVTLYPIEVDNGNTMGVSVELMTPVEAGGRTFDTLHLEYRRNIGFDRYLDILDGNMGDHLSRETPMTSVDHDGVLVTVGRSTDGKTSSWLLDTHPYTPYHPNGSLSGNSGKMADAFLTVGETLDEPELDVTVEVLELTADGGIKVEVATR